MTRKSLDAPKAVAALAAAIFTLYASNDSRAQDGRPEGGGAAAGWEISAGAGTLVGPAYPGADIYHVSALPLLRLSYGERFFASVEEGVGYTVINSGGWSAGPLVRVGFGRDEDASGPFRVAGRRTDALRGLGDLPTAVEAGGFAQHEAGSLRTSLELRQGLTGHKGFTASLSTRYVFRFSPPLEGNGSGMGPGILAVGPNLTLADGRYRRAYFGVDAAQSARSQLNEFAPAAGLNSVGFGGVAIFPVAENISMTAIAGYERLLGVGRSPIVGSAHQFVFGLFFSRAFKWGGP